MNPRFCLAKAAYYPYTMSPFGKTHSDRPIAIQARSYRCSGRDATPSIEFPSRVVQSLPSGRRAIRPRRKGATLCPRHDVLACSNGRVSLLPRDRKLLPVNTGLYPSADSVPITFPSDRALPPDKGHSATEHLPHCQRSNLLDFCRQAERLQLLLVQDRVFVILHLSNRLSSLVCILCDHHSQLGRMPENLG